MNILTFKPGEKRIVDFLWGVGVAPEDSIYSYYMNCTNVATGVDVTAKAITHVAYDIEDIRLILMMGAWPVDPLVEGDIGGGLNGELFKVTGRITTTLGLVFEKSTYVEFKDFYDDRIDKRPEEIKNITIDFEDVVSTIDNPYLNFYENYFADGTWLADGTAIAMGNTFPFLPPIVTITKLSDGSDVSAAMTTHNLSQVRKAIFDLKAGTTGELYKVHLFYCNAESILDTSTALLVFIYDILLEVR